MSVELIYEQECPGLQDARHALVEALTSLELDAQWSEWEISDPGLPAHAEGFASLTVLVEGRDVAGAEPHQQNAGPRHYGRNQPAPSADMIREALRKQVLTPREQARNPPAP